MRVLARLRSLLQDQKGNALLIGAATMPLIIGAAAIAVDTAQVTLARRQLQRMADSAALAGAYALVQSQSVNTSVNRDLTLNSDMTLSTAPVIQNAPTVGPYAGNTRAVRVVLAHQHDVPFMSFFTGSTMGVSVEATAAIVYTGQYCMISLETGNVNGINFTGNTTANLGCGVISNARSGSAVTAVGSAVVVASPVAAVGGVPSSGAYASGTTLMPYSPPQADPYAGLPTPSVPSPCSNELRVQPQEVLTLTANATGIYCYRGMDIKGTVNLQPGIYYIDGNLLNFGAQSVVNGTGVTFILTSSTAATQPSSIANISINGGAQMNLSSPTSGTYKGVLMYQDRRALFGTSQINGNSATSFEGGFYFPSRQLTFNGTTGMQTTCIQMVALRLEFSGNSTVQNSCPASGGGQAFNATVVRLVG
jgi:Flp pilus assembly protein TadG